MHEFYVYYSKTLSQVIFDRSVESFEKNMFKEIRDNFVPYLFKISSELNRDPGQPLAMFGCCKLILYLMAKPSKGITKGLTSQIRYPIFRKEMTCSLGQEQDHLTQQFERDLNAKIS